MFVKFWHLAQILEIFAQTCVRVSVCFRNSVFSVHSLPIVTVLTITKESVCTTFISFTIMQYIPLVDLYSVLYSFLASEKPRAPSSNQDKFELDKVGCSIPREKHQLYSCVTVLFVVIWGCAIWGRGVLKYYSITINITRVLQYQLKK